jgi:hypothetical protein
MEGNLGAETYDISLKLWGLICSLFLYMPLCIGEGKFKIIFVKPRTNKTCWKTLRVRLINQEIGLEE